MPGVNSVRSTPSFLIHSHNVCNLTWGTRGSSVDIGWSGSVLWIPKSAPTFSLQSAIRLFAASGSAWLATKDAGLSFRVAYCPQDNVVFSVKLILKIMPIRMVTMYSILSAIYPVSLILFRSSEVWCHQGYYFWFNACFSMARGKWARTYIQKRSRWSATFLKTKLQSASKGFIGFSKCLEISTHELSWSPRLYPNHIRKTCARNMWQFSDFQNSLSSLLSKISFWK